MSTYVVGIDPAFGGTGIAVFEDGVLIKVTLIKKTGKRPFEDRAHDLTNDVLLWITDAIPFQLDTTRVVCEIPAYQASPQRAMGWKKGDLQKLTYLVGAFGYACAGSYHYETVTPAGWKGQLSKDLVIKRIRKRMPGVDEKFAPKKDIWDAIGIGLWALGEM